jgi:hypothetical protein
MYVCMCVYVCMYVCMYVCTYVCMYVRTYVLCMYVCMYVCMCACISSTHVLVYIERVPEQGSRTLCRQPHDSGAGGTATGYVLNGPEIEYQWG